MKALKWLRDEWLKIRSGFFFFAGISTLIVATDHILGRHSGLLIPGFGRAIIGGLIAGKILILVDLLPFIERYRHKPLIYGILWKSLFYFATFVGFKYLEPFVRGLIRGLGFWGANRLSIQLFEEPRTWALALWVAVLTVFFVTMRELNRSLGHHRVREMILGPTETHSAR
jgi:hypothetical protein